jgi:RecB family exonuclease
VAPVPIRVATHTYGDAAFAVLASTVRRAKQADPLSPATVVVDRGPLALSVRRRLASTPPGVAHLRCTTWVRFAAELAQHWLSAGRRVPASPAIELEAVRSALVEETPSHLAGALDQPATLRALARTYRDLAAVSAVALDALAAQSPRAADVVGVVRRVRSALSDCVGTAELLAAAAAEVRRQPGRAAETCGQVAVYLPRRIGPPELELIETLGGCTDVEVIVGAVGDVIADGEARQLVTRLSGGAGRSATVDGGPEESGSARALAPTWVRSAPSADAEVLMALRHLMGRNAEGVPLERMALLHGGGPTYRQLVHDALAVAGIPAHGESARPLSSTVAGRALLGAVALPDHDWRRDDVTAWLASAPMLSGGHLVPAAEWNALSAEAGVVSGLGQWRERLGVHARSLRERARACGLAGAEAGADELDGTEDGSGPDAAGGDPGSSARARLLQIDARRCDELRSFLDTMAERLGRAPTSWEAWGEWARRLLADLFGPPARRAGWPDDEVVAFDAVGEALGRIGALDWLRGLAPTAADFRTALAAELDAPAPGTARIGRGLLVGRVEEAIGLDLEVVYVVGMVDGALPARQGDDVLLPDRERERAGDEVPLRAVDAASARRDFLAALAGAREQVLSCSRYDQRHGRELRPAPLFLEAVDALAGDGRRHAARELRGGPPPGLGERFQFVSSFAAAVGDGGGSSDAVSDADWRLRSLVRWVAARRRVSDHFLARDDASLAGSLAVRRARRSAQFTRFDGLVEHLEIPSPRSGAVQSATSLERLARCPRSYLFSHLLRVTVRELPETLLQLAPAERGLIVHRVLERLVAAEMVAGSSVEEDSSAREARMLVYAEEEFEEARRRGVTGHPALWALERSKMTSDLRAHLRDENEYRVASGARSVAVELDFGPPSETDVSVDTPRGDVRFRGRIDRVDELADGSVAVVDYKSGRPYGVLEGGDPLSGGQRLQLPVYALAARAAFGASRRVRAGYWFVGSPDPPEWLDLDEAVQSRLQEVLGTLAETIETGRFPARPGPSDGRPVRGSNCTYCPYDGMCPPDRVTSWRRKRADRALSSYVALVGET